MFVFEGWWHVVPDEERRMWVLEPFVGVGPLRFGMGPGEVADAMGDVTAETERYLRGCPADAHVYTVEEGRYPEFGLHLYYRHERLAGVVVDALCGPQVLADGTALVGRVPSVLERWLLDRAETRPPYTELAYMSAGVPSSQSLGVTINVNGRATASSPARSSTPPRHSTTSPTGCRRRPGRSTTERRGAPCARESTNDPLTRGTAAPADVDTRPAYGAMACLPDGEHPSRAAIPRTQPAVPEPPAHEGHTPGRRAPRIAGVCRRLLCPV
ncbi:hypothetical protein [Embleya sp. MST-111070]|uniref:hypothetical protein n=1 Tax=Embleya sp. MST-111070 TaxID=3398231 RepID=UPI003F733BA8